MFGLRLDAGQGYRVSLIPVTLPVTTESAELLADADLKPHFRTHDTIAPAYFVVSARLQQIDTRIHTYSRLYQDEIAIAPLSPPMPRPPEHPRHSPLPSCLSPDPLGGPQRASISFHPPRPRANTPSPYKMTGKTGLAPLAGAISHVAVRPPAPFTRLAGCSTAASRTAWAR